MSVISHLEPKKVFKYFEEICAIPHGSGNTSTISNYLAEYANGHDLKYIQDQANNIIIFKSGSKGHEDADPVIIQGHMDMVCEKTQDSNIDFETQGLTLLLDGDTITADGTTLGGDDGIAVAYALAILDSDDIVHPPLEVVITVDEEIGMLGAAALDCSPLKGHTMLNIDSEDENHLLVSCAGGLTASCKLPVKFVPSEADSIFLTLKVSGISGGHSGMEIIKKGANADILLGRVLLRLSETFDFTVADVCGGGKDNAIPREAYATLCLPKDYNESLFNEKIDELKNHYKEKYAVTDPELNVESYINLTKDSEQKIPVFSLHSFSKLITALNLLPNGVQKMSPDMEDLVQTSLNLGILKTEKIDKNEGFVYISFCVRSSVDSEKEELAEKITYIISELGGTIKITGNYPGWKYNKDSKLRKLMEEIHKEQYGYDAIIDAIHAGVECGIFADKIKNLDCVSFGPDLKDIHTTSEAMSVSSVQRTWVFLLETLKRLA